MKHRPKQPRRRSGAILLIALVVTGALLMIVLSLGASMRVELQVASNVSAGAQAQAVERGAEQYVLGLIQNGYGISQSVTDDLFYQVPIGDGCFYVVRPNFDDDSLPVWGLVEEGSKINLNNPSAAITRTMLLNVLEDQDTSDAVISWRSTTGSGDDEYYLTRPESAPYQAKHAPFETVEELLLVRGITRPLLYGDGTGPQPGERGNVLSRPSNGVLGDTILQRGIYDLFTVTSKDPTTDPDGTALPSVNNNNGWGNGTVRTLLQHLPDQSRATEIMARMQGQRPTSVLDLYARGGLTPDEVDALADYAPLPAMTGGQRPIRVNINQAPSTVLSALAEAAGLAPSVVDRLIAQRQSSQPAPGQLGWVAEALGSQPEEMRALGPYIVGRSYIFSADIVAFSRNARAFKRCKIIIDATNVLTGGVAQIIFRRDMTDLGCPISNELESLRSGQSSRMNGRSAFSAGGAFR